MHIKRNWVSGILGSLVFCAMLTACGGGEGGEATATPAVTASSAEGLWTGTSAEGRAVAGAVLDDGSYWFLYSVVGQPAVVGGAVQGTGEGQFGTFTSSNARDFYSERPQQLNGTLTATYVERQRLNGVLAYPLGVTPSGETVFQARPFTTTFSPLNDEVSDLTQLAGAYTGAIRSFGFNYTVTVTVSPDGAVTMPDGGFFSTAGVNTSCGYTGQLSPRAHGNVYDIVLLEGTRGCNPPDTLTGIAVFEAATNRLYVLAVTKNRSDVFPFMGTKQ